VIEMKTPDREPIFSNDADIIILDESEGVTNTIRRPATGASLKMAMEYLQKEAELIRKKAIKENPEATAARQQEANGEHRLEEA
jgi:hypothetical protein